MSAPTASSIGRPRPRPDWEQLDRAVLVIWKWAKRLNPIVGYRAIALLIAVVIIASSLHAESSLARHAWILLLAAAHLTATALVAPRLERRSDLVNLLAIAIDVGICVFLLAATYGWRGPFWLYSLSAVFWPAVRFSLPGALISVAAFDALLLATNVEQIRDTTRDGFGGDLLARLLMVLIIAGAISLTSRAVTQMKRLGAEAERHRIARDLHDGVGKTLGGISMEALSLGHWIERDPVEASRRARYLARISERAAIDVRDVIRGLRETEATTRLFPTVRRTVDDWTQAHGLPVSLQLNGSDAEVPVLIHGEIVRMLTEFLANVERHAHADEVRVRVTLSSSGVTLAVRDDGVGFDAGSQDPWADEGHFGLLGARERASMLDGRFRLISAPGQGTEVTVDLPLTVPDDRAIALSRHAGVAGR